MTYKRAYKGITRWHESTIHDRITSILGYDTWPLSTSVEVGDLIDLTLEFESREDYERCVGAIVTVLNQQPPI